MQDRTRTIVVAGVVALFAATVWFVRGTETPPRVEAPVAPATRPAATPGAAPSPRRRAAAEPDAPAETDEPPHESPLQTVKLVVRVVAVGSEKPIAGATVRFYKGGDDPERPSLTTDADGAARATVEYRALAPYLLVSAPGFVREGWLGWNHEDEAGAEVVVRLHPGLAVEGVVLDARTGAPVPGARVSASRGGEAQTHCYRPPDADIADDLVVGADGAFRLDGLPPEDGALIDASADGHARGLVSWTKDSPRRLAVSLAPAGTVRGVVRDAAGAPAAGAVACARGVGPDAWRTNETAKADAQGRYELTGLAFGRDFDVWAQGEHDASAPTHGVRVTAQAPSATVDLAFLRPATVVVHVHGPDGAPIAEQIVSLAMESFEVVGTTDAAGVLSRSVAQPGRCRVVVERDEFLPGEVAFDAAPGETHVVEVALNPGLTVTGVVADDAGEPVAGADVWTVQGREPVPGARSYHRADASTSEDGTFRLTGLTTVPFELHVDARAHESVLVAGVVAPKDGLRVVQPRCGEVVFTVRQPTAAPRIESLVLSFDRTVADGSSTTTRRTVLVEDEPISESVPAGRQVLALTAPGFAPAIRRFDLAPGVSVDLGEIVLDAGLVATGRVTDAAGHGVPGASVKAMVAGDDSDPTTATDATGAFRLGRFPADGAFVSATADGFLPSLTRGRHDARPGEPLVVVLARGGRIVGKAVDAERRIVAKDVWNRVEGPIVGESEGRRSFLDLDALLAFETRLAPGRWRVTLMGGDKDLATKDVELREGEDTLVDLELPR